jgi:hypothetical protein
MASKKRMENDPGKEKKKKLVANCDQSDEVIGAQLLCLQTQSRDGISV